MKLWATDIFQAVVFIAVIFTLVLIATGCAKPQIVKEYVYLEANCTKPEEVIEPKLYLNIRWVVIDTNTTRYYATPDGASLLTNIRSCYGR